MFRKPDPSDWMWAHAVEVMAQAERMHQQFFRLTVSTRPQVAWEPPVDILEDEREVVVMIAMPGVAPERVEVTSEPGVLIIRGERPVPFANGRHAIRQLEIPYGAFERRIPLRGVRLDAATQKIVDGCFVLRLNKLSQP